MREYILRYLVPNCTTWHRRVVRFLAADDEEAIEKAVVLSDRVRRRTLGVSFHVELTEGPAYIDHLGGPEFFYRKPNEER